MKLGVKRLEGNKIKKQSEVGSRKSEVGSRKPKAGGYMLKAVTGN